MQLLTMIRNRAKKPNQNHSAHRHSCNQSAARRSIVVRTVVMSPVINHINARTALLAFTLVTWVLIPSVFAQPAAERPRNRGPQGPQVISPEVLPDRRVTFRVL